MPGFTPFVSQSDNGLSISLGCEPYISGQVCYVGSAIEFHYILTVLQQNPYLVSAVQRAAELGLYAMIDLHGAPGSQNGWHDSGLVGNVLFLTN